MESGTQRSTRETDEVGERGKQHQRHTHTRKVTRRRLARRTAAVLPMGTFRRNGAFSLLLVLVGKVVLLNRSIYEVQVGADSVRPHTRKDGHDDVGHIEEQEQAQGYSE